MVGSVNFFMPVSMRAEGNSLVIDVGDRVDRLDLRLSLSLESLVEVGGVGLLDVAGIAHHDPGQIGGGVGGVDRALVALANQVRKVAAVIDVRVG